MDLFNRFLNLIGIGKKKEEEEKKKTLTPSSFSGLKSKVSDYGYTKVTGEDVPFTQYASKVPSSTSILGEAEPLLGANKYSKVTSLLRDYSPTTNKIGGYTPVPKEEIKPATIGERIYNFQLGDKKFDLSKPEGIKGLRDYKTSEKKRVEQRISEGKPAVEIVKPDISKLTGIKKIIAEGQAKYEPKPVTEDMSTFTGTVKQLAKDVILGSTKPTKETLKKNIEKYTTTKGDAAQAAKEAYEDYSFLPWVGDAIQAQKINDVLQTAYRIKAAADRGEEPDEYDSLFMQEFLAHQDQEKTAGYEITHGVAQLPAFWGEFGAGKLLMKGAIDSGKKGAVEAVQYSLKKFGKEIAKETGKEAVEKGAKKEATYTLINKGVDDLITDNILRKTGKEAVKEISSEAAEKTIVKGMKEVAAPITKTATKATTDKVLNIGAKATKMLIEGTLASPVIMATSVPRSFLEKWVADKVVPEIDPATGKPLRDNNNFIKYAINDNADVVDYALKAFGENWVEVVSELSGGVIAEAFSPLTKPIKNILMKSAILKNIIEGSGPKWFQTFSNGMRNLGWNGFLEEMGEERVADAMNGILYAIGLSDQQWNGLPSLDQLGIEAAILMIPGAAMKGVRYGGGLINQVAANQSRSQFVGELNKDRGKLENEIKVLQEKRDGNPEKGIEPQVLNSDEVARLWAAQQTVDYLNQQEKQLPTSKEMAESLLKFPKYESPYSSISAISKAIYSDNKDQVKYLIDNMPEEDVKTKLEDFSDIGDKNTQDILASSGMDDKLKLETLTRIYTESNGAYNGRYMTDKGYKTGEVLGASVDFDNFGYLPKNYNGSIADGVMEYNLGVLIKHLEPIGAKVIRITGDDIFIANDNASIQEVNKALENAREEVKTKRWAFRNKKTGELEPYQSNFTAAQGNSYEDASSHFGEMKLGNRRGVTENTKTLDNLIERGIIDIGEKYGKQQPTTRTTEGLLTERPGGEAEKVGEGEVGEGRSTGERLGVSRPRPAGERTLIEGEQQRSSRDNSITLEYAKYLKNKLVGKGIPLEVVASILGNDKISAVLKDGKIMIKEGKLSLASVVEESGHAIFSILTNQEKKELIAEIKKQYPDIESIVKELPQYKGVYGTDYDSYAEELIMKRLVDYAESIDKKKKFEPKNLSQKVINFFNNIIDRLKSLLNYGDKIYQFNKKVLNGELAKRTEKEFQNKESILKLLQEKGFGQSDIFGEVTPVKPEAKEAPKRQDVFKIFQQFGIARQLTPEELREQEKAKKTVLPGQLSLISAIDKAKDIKEKYRLTAEYYYMELLYKLNAEGYSASDDYLHPGMIKISSVGNRSTKAISGVIKRAAEGKAIYNGDGTWSIPESKLFKFADLMDIKLEGVSEASKFRIEDEYPEISKLWRKESEDAQKKYNEWLNSQPEAVKEAQALSDKVKQIPNEDNRNKYAEKLKREFDNKWIEKYNKTLKEKIGKFDNVKDVISKKNKEFVSSINSVVALPRIFQFSRRFESDMNPIWGYIKEKVEGITKRFDINQLNPIEVGVFDNDVEYALPNGEVVKILADTPYVISGHNTLEIMKRNIDKIGDINQYIDIKRYPGTVEGVRSAIGDSIITNVRNKSIKDIELMDNAINDLISNEDVEVALDYSIPRIKQFNSVVDVIKEAGLVDFWNQYVGPRLSDFRKFDYNVMTERLNFIGEAARKLHETNKDLAPNTRQALNSQVGILMSKYMEPSRTMTLKAVRNTINDTINKVVNGNYSATEQVNLFNEALVKIELNNRDKVKIMQDIINKELESYTVPDEVKKYLTDINIKITEGNPEIIKIIQEESGGKRGAAAQETLLKLLDIVKNNVQMTPTIEQEAEQQIKQEEPNIVQKAMQTKADKEMAKQEIATLKMQNMKANNEILQLKIEIAQAQNIEDTEVARYIDAMRQLQMYKLKSDIIQRNLRISYKQELKDEKELQKEKLEAEKQKQKDRQEAINSIIKYVNTIPKEFRGEVYNKLINRIKNIKDSDSIYHLGELANEIHNNVARKKFISLIKKEIKTINMKSSQISKRVDVNYINIINELVGDIDFSNAREKLFNRIVKLQEKIQEIIKTKHFQNDKGEKRVISGSDIRELVNIYKHIESVKKQPMSSLTNEQVTGINKMLSPYYQYMGLNKYTENELYKKLSVNNTKYAEFLRIENYLNEQQNAGKDVEMPSKILRELEILKKKPVESMTAEELENIYNRIKLYKEIGLKLVERRKSIIKLESEIMLDEILKDAKGINSFQEIENPDIGDPLPLIRRVINKIGLGKDFINKTFLGFYQRDIILNILDNNKPDYDGGNMKYFGTYVDVAYGKFIMEYTDVKEQYEKLRRELKLTKGNMERIGVYAALQQEFGKEKLLYSGYTEEQLKRIEQRGLDEAEMKMYQYMRQIFDSWRPKVAEVLRKEFNIDLGEEHNYFPFVTDFDRMEQKGIDVKNRFNNFTEDQINLDNKDNRGKVKYTSKEFAYVRKKVGGQVIKTNAESIFLGHMSNIIYLMELSHPLNVLNKVAENPKYREAVGDYGSNWINNYLQLIARKGGLAGETTIELVTRFRQNTGFAILGMKLSTILIQPSALIGASSEIGGNYSLKGATMLPNKEWRNFLMNNSPWLRSRAGDDFAFLDKPTFNALKKAQEISFWGLKKMDSFTSAAALGGAYLKYLDDHNIPLDMNNVNQDAMNYAERVSRATQVSNAFIHMPAALSQSKHRWLIKTLTMFQLFPIVSTFNRLSYDFMTLGVKQGHYGKAAKILFYTILMVMFEQLIRGLVDDMWDWITGEEDDEQYANTMLNNVTFSILGTTPILSNVISANRYGGTGIALVDMYIKAIGGIKKMTTGKTSSTKARGALETLEGVGAMTGIPGASEISRKIKSTLPTAAESKAKSSTSKSTTTGPKTKRYVTPQERYKNVLEKSKKSSSTKRYSPR